MAVVDAVDIAQQDECVGLHHLSDEAAQLVVICEHQLSDADGVVLVDDGDDTIFQHHPHAGLLIAVLLTRLEVLLHGQYLSDMDMVLTEQVVI